MKLLPLVALSLLAACTSETPSARDELAVAGQVTASSTVDTYAPAGTTALASDVHVTASGRVVVVGTAKTGAASQQLLVRRGRADGTGWVSSAVIDTRTCFAATGVSTSAGLLLHTMMVDPDGTSRYVVRRSSDDGASFTTIHDAPLGEFWVEPSIAAARDGTLYVALSLGDAFEDTSLVVRRSADGGATWSEIDRYRLAPSASAQATGIGVDAAGNVYVGGHARDAAGKRHAIVRKSVDGGAAWTTVEDFQATTGQSTLATAFGVSPAGAVAWAGMARAETGVVTWIVRASTDRGAAWATLDDRTLTGGSGPSAIAFDATSTYVTGTFGDAWVTRRHDGSAWQELDTFVPEAKGLARPYGLAVSRDALYAVGGYQDVGQADPRLDSAWFVRRSSR